MLKSLKICLHQSFFSLSLTHTSRHHQLASCLTLFLIYSQMCQIFNNNNSSSSSSSSSSSNNSNYNNNVLSKSGFVLSKWSSNGNFLVTRSWWFHRDKENNDLVVVVVVVIEATIFSRNLCLFYSYTYLTIFGTILDLWANFVLLFCLAQVTFFFVTIWSIFLLFVY